MPQQMPGIVVVAPAGDDGPGYMSIDTPGAAQKAITVGAYNSFTGDVWNESSRDLSTDFSVRPDVIAPGVGLIGVRSQIVSQNSLALLSSLTSAASQYGINYNPLQGINLTALTNVIPATSYGTLPFLEKQIILKRVPLVHQLQS